MKQVIVWSLIFLVLFVVLIGLAFVGLTYMTPSPEELKAAKLANQKQAAKQVSEPVKVYSEVSTDSTRTVPKKKAPKMTPVDSLQSIVNQLTGDLFFTRVTVDSLNEQLGQKEELIEGYNSQIEALEKSVQTLKDKKVSLRDLAKTYETMKVSEIRPILEKVDDETIMALYRHMGSRTKKNLIQALSGVRAAQITKKLAGS